MVLGEGWSVTPFYYFRMQGLGDYARWTGGRGAILAARLDRCENEGRGLDLCEEWRQTPLDNPKSGELRQAMTNLYRPIYDLLDPSWGATVGRGGKSQDANVALNSASSSSSRPELPTSAGWTGSQSPPGSKEAQAAPPNMRAGRDSQSTKVNMDPLLALDGDWRKAMVKGNIDPDSDLQNGARQLDLRCHSRQHQAQRCDTLLSERKIYYPRVVNNKQQKQAVI